MDKFTFDDIIFNVGLRVDRFDANQPVLKDPYVVGQSYTVGDIQGADGEGIINTLSGNAFIPENIGEDFAVYVDALEGPGSIVGFRDGDTWYNSVGTEITDPDVLAVNTAYPAPWLKPNDNATGDDPFELTSEAFRDYDPAVNIMPRISFSFNISDEAVFFAHYDILTQRPTSSNRFSPIDYLFLESRNNLISNPDLRPEKTIDYELGFQQVLTKTSSLKISAYYKEMRDMIQVRNFTGAYPRPYKAFGNLDFGTVKGFTVGYDMRRTGNVRLNANYTLQFADGTGSTTQTALALINAGLPNLRSINPFNYDQRHRIVANVDYRYGAGEEYNGPVVKFGGKGASVVRQHRLERDRQPRLWHALHGVHHRHPNHRGNQPLHRRVDQRQPLAMAVQLGRQLGPQLHVDLRRRRRRGQDHQLEPVLVDWKRAQHTQHQLGVPLHRRC